MSTKKPCLKISERNYKFIRGDTPHPYAMNIAKHIPNTITSLNLVSGGMAIFCSFRDRFDYALYFIILAAILDFCDGLAARILNAYSETGRELDSLADVISFGLAPSLILVNYMRGFPDLSLYTPFIPLILAAFSALRLAKFNLDTRQSTSFLGLPVPASALFTASSIVLATEYPVIAASFLSNDYVIPILAFALSLLLVSEIPMFSMKMKNFRWSDNKTRYIFFIIIIPAGAAIYFSGIHWSGIISFIFLFYILFNTGRCLFGKLSDNPL